MRSRAIVALAALVSPAADATLLHRSVDVANEDPQSPEAIKEKWDKMDEFLATMFKISCSWKHGKDVDGEAAEALDNDEIKPRELAKFKAKIQKKNVQDVRDSCGFIVSKGTHDCRKNCAKNQGSNMVARMKCDQSCITTYHSFERSCKSKADDLEKVYESKQKMAQAKKACYNDHCGELPTVWLKAEDKQEDERDKGCETACKESRIKAKCEKKFALDIEFTMAKIKTECEAESEMSDCMGDHETDASDAETECSDEGKTKCEDSHKDCMKHAEDKDKSAAEFCDERKKKCEDQTSEKCLKKHDDILKDGEKECKKEDDERQDLCVDEKVSEKSETFVDDCIAETEPKCTETCEKDCNIEKMNSCLDNLGSTADLTDEYCNDFYHLLSSSSEVDPVTGNPIVLLHNKALIKKAWIPESK